MTTKSEILALAQRRSRINQQLRHRQGMNIPSDPEEALKFDVNHQLLLEASKKANAEYFAAIRDLSAEEMEAIINESD